MPCLSRGSRESSACELSIELRRDGLIADHVALHRLREALIGDASCLKHEARHRESINFLNNYLTDFVNALWKKKLLDQKDTTAMNLSAWVSIVLSLSHPS